MSLNGDERPEVDRQDNNRDDISYEQIVQGGSITAKSERGIIHCLTIIGQIEGHEILPASSKTTKYEHVMPQLAAIEESDEIDGLLILLNTMGGDIEAGLAISELVAGIIYRALGLHDHTSGPTKRYGGRRPPDLFLFSENSGENSFFRLFKLKDN
jgi:hypothetical protein